MFSHRMGDIAYLSGVATGAVVLAVCLCSGVTVVGGIPLLIEICKSLRGWVPIVIPITVPSLGDYGGSIIGNQLVERESVKQRRQEARTMAEQIMNKPKASCQKQLIALFRMRISGVGLSDPAGH